MRSLAISISIFLITVFSGCTGKLPAPFQSLSPADFHQLAASAEMVILDVRTLLEVEEGMIHGAIQLDYNSPDFKTQLEGLDRESVYGVYCGHGGRSQSTLQIMKSMGFSKVYDLDGGYTAYLEYVK